MRSRPSTPPLPTLRALRPATLALVLATAVAAPGAVLAWEFEVVDTGNVGNYASLKADENRLHVAHFGGSQGILKYAYYDGAAWTNEVVDAQFLTGHHPTVDLDSARRPHIAYRFYTGRSIRYASRGDSGWTFTEFETDGNIETDIWMAIDAADRPHVSYYDGYFQGEPHDLKYAIYDGGVWATTLVDAPGQVGRGSSIAVDSQGHPHISYYDETNADLKHATFDGAQWHVAVVDDVETIGFNFRTSIAVDAGDHVHVVYSAYHYQAPDWVGRLKYAVLDEGGWTVATIEQGLPTRDFRVPDIAIDPADRVHVSYIAYYNTEPITPDLKYARLDGVGWSIEMVDPGDLADSDYSCSIDVDWDFRPQVAYAKTGRLMHAWNDSPDAVEPPSWPPVGTAAAALSPPFPNPCDGSATLRFFLPEAGAARLDLYDAQGRRLATPVSGSRRAGHHEVTLEDLPAGGVVLCRLATDRGAACRKLAVR